MRKGVVLGFSLYRFVIVFGFIAFISVKIIFGQSTWRDTIKITEVDVNANFMEGDLKSATGSISVLSTENIESQDQITISQQLNTLPGIYMHAGTYNTNRIVIRGIGSRTPYSSNRIRAYLNDIPLTNGDGVTTLEDLDVTSIGRIEITKGPGSALYGSGLGGTIKLMTKSLEPSLEAKFRYGSFNSEQLKLASGFHLGESKLVSSVHHTHSDGYRENSRYNSYSGILTAARNWKKTDMMVILFAVTMNAQIPSSVDVNTFKETPEKAASNWLTAGGFEQSHRLLSGLTVNHHFSEQVSVKTTLFAGASGSFEHRPFNDLDDQSSNYGIRSRAQYHSSTFDLISGIELYSERYNWATSLDESGVFTSLDEIAENRKYANLFGFASYHAGEKLILTGAINLNRLNYVYSGNNGNDAQYSYPFIFSPRIGFNYTATQRINYYGSFGHGFSTPSLEETLMPDGEKDYDLKPETGWMSELGVRISNLNASWFMDACLYSISLNNLLVTKRISEEIFMGINAGKTNHFGVEIQSNYNVFSFRTFPGRLSVNGAVTLSKNSFIDFEDDGNKYSGNKLPGIPAQTVYTGLLWNPRHDISINIHQQYFGKQYLNDANSENYSGYFLVNLNGKYQYSISQNVKILFEFGINNLLNSNYASMILVNAPAFGGNAPRYYYSGLPQNLYGCISFLL